jgi:DNA repair protein RecO (recombination protein O)
MTLGKTIRDSGVVLRTVKLGEADRIVTLLTVNNGKIIGVAKGARKSGSKYSARLETGNVVDFQWITSTKELVRITQTDTVHANRNLRENLDLINATARMLDAVDALCEDHSPHDELAIMTIKALATMNEMNSTNICGAFLFKLISLEGFGPETSSCPGCSTKDNLEYFSPGKAAFYCRECCTSDMVQTLQATRMSLDAILNGKLKAVLKSIPPEVALEIESMAVSMIEFHTGHGLRAVNV